MQADTLPKSHERHKVAHGVANLVILLSLTTCITQNSVGVPKMTGQSVILGSSSTIMI